MFEELVKKGLALKKLGRHEAAVEFFKRAVEINPRNEATWNFLGTSLKKLGRVDEALESFYKAFDIKPNASNAFYVGATLYDIKRYEELLDFMNVVKDICWSEHLEKLSMMASQQVEKIVSTGQKEVKNTANAKVLLNNESLENFVNAAKISQEQKDIWLSKIPKLDEEQRIKLFKMLAKIRLLNLEEQEALKRVEKFWKE